MATQLCPAQQHTFDQLNHVLPLFSTLGLAGQSGSTILRCLYERTGGEWISMRELLRAFRNQHPLDKWAARQIQLTQPIPANRERAAVPARKGRGGPRPGLVQQNAAYPSSDTSTAHRCRMGFLSRAISSTARTA